MCSFFSLVSTGFRDYTVRCLIVTKCPTTEGAGGGCLPPILGKEGRNSGKKSWQGEKNKTAIETGSAISLMSTILIFSLKIDQRGSNMVCLRKSGIALGGHRIFPRSKHLITCVLSNSK